jgi:hypothetical protein
MIQQQYAPLIEELFAGSHEWKHLEPDDLSEAKLGVTIPSQSTA